MTPSVRRWLMVAALVALPAVVRAVDAPLMVELGRLRAQAPGAASGSIGLRVIFPTSPPTDVLDASSGFRLVVRDGATLDWTAVWTAADCEPTSRGGFLCRLPTILWKLRLDPLRGTTSWRATIRMKKLALDGPFAAPLSVRFTTSPGIDRVGVSSNCKTSGTGTLTCRKPLS